MDVRTTEHGTRLKAETLPPRAPTHTHTHTNTRSPTDRVLHGLRRCCSTIRRRRSSGGGTATCSALCIATATASDTSTSTSTTPVIIVDVRSRRWRRQRRSHSALAPCSSTVRRRRPATTGAWVGVLRQMRLVLAVAAGAVLARRFARRVVAVGAVGCMRAHATRRVGHQRDFIVNNDTPATNPVDCTYSTQRLRVYK